MLLGDMVYRVGAKIEGFERGMTKVSKTINKVDRQTAKSLAGFNRMGQRLSDVGGRVSMGFSVPLAAAAGLATKFSNDFNASMANVATLMPGNTARVHELKAAIQDMSVDVVKRTGDLAGGLYQVVSAFGDTSDTVKILETNARAATAGLATTEEAIALTSAVTKGYGDTTAGAVEKVADLAFKTVELGQTTFPELAASMGTVVPLASSMNVSIEELFGGMATLTGVTGTASEVATQFRSVLAGMAKPTKDMEVAMADLGFASAEAMVQELGMVGALDALVGSTDGSAASVAKLFGRIEATNAVLALTGGQADTFKTKFAAMGEATGAVDRAFEEATEGVNKHGITLAKVKIKAENVAQEFGDQLAPALGSALEALMPLLEKLVSAAEWFGNLPEPIRTTTIAVGALAVAFGPLMLAVGQGIQTIGAFAQILGPLGKMLPLVTAKLGSLAAAFKGGTGLVGLLGSAGPLAIAFGVALAGWALYKAITKMRALNAEMERMEAIMRRNEAATEDQAEEIRILEGILERHRKTVDSTGLTVEEYIKALREAAAELGTFGEASTMVTDETGKITISLKGFGEQAAKSGREASDGVGGAGDSAKAAAEDFVALSEVLSDIEQQRAGEKLLAEWQQIQELAAQARTGITGVLVDIQEETEATTLSTEELDAVMRRLSEETLREGALAGIQQFDRFDEVLTDITQETKTLDETMGEWIDQTVQDVPKLGDVAEKAGEKWGGLGRQVSTVLTDLSRGIGDTLFATLFGGDEQRKRLLEEEANLKESLDERRLEWEAYQVDIAEEMEGLQLAYEQSLEAAGVALSEDLGERRSRYEEDLRNLQDSLREREQDYYDYQKEVAGRLVELREAHATELARELEDLEDNLAERTEAYGEYVSDQEKKLGRLRERNEDDLRDERRRVGRRIDDSTRKLHREEQDLKARRSRLIQEGKSADSEEIRDLDTKLARLREDHQIYVARLEEDYADYTEEHNRKLQQQEEDINTSLERRKADHDEYVVETGKKAEAITSKHETQLAAEEADLQGSLDERLGKLEQFRVDTAAKREELSAEWQTYQEEAVAEFETIKSEAATKLDEQKTELTTKLQEHKGEWETYVGDVNTELAKIGEGLDETTLFGRIKSGFEGVLTEMGTAITRFGTEELTGKLFKWFREDLLGDIFPKLSGWMSRIFGTGGGGGVAGAAGEAVTGGAGGGGPVAAAGGVATSGVMGWITAISGVVTAIASVGQFIQGFRQTGLLGDIEEETRKGTLHGLFSLEKLNEYLPYLKTINETLYFLLGAQGLIGEINERLKHDFSGKLGDSLSEMRKIGGELGAQGIDIRAIRNITEIGNARLLAQLQRGFEGLKADVRMDVHFDGLVAAVAAKVKADIAAEVTLQRA